MNIGDLRRSLFVDHACKWNGLVRDITANQEMAGEEVYPEAVYVGLLETLRCNASLDHQFPRENKSRVDELFAESA